jgi:DNA-3-methyladenine glycosylase
VRIGSTSPILSAVDDGFFDRPALELAPALLGAVLRRRVGERWLAATIVEAEAYLRSERASHSSLGRTPSREPMFGPPGTLYLYHSRAGASLNLSARGDGDAVLIKAAVPWGMDPDALDAMHRLNPAPGGGRRPDHRLCSGQALLCRALDLRVAEWTGRRFDRERFWLDAGPPPSRIVRTPRLGIPPGRDEHLPYRFVHAEHAASATRNPLTRRDPVGRALFDRSALVPGGAGRGGAPGEECADDRR